MTEIIITAVLLMAVLGLILGIVIGAFARIFKVETDPRIDLVVELLPGANCGGCGTAGCADFAKSVIAGINPPGKCPVCSAEQASSIARVLGIEVGSVDKKKAIVRCGGDANQTKRAAAYIGVSDCVSASLVAGGFKGCTSGCLGLGTCANKCPFGAIEMINSLAVIHEELCVGCGNCVAACPRGVIQLVPAEASHHVYCNSLEKGVDKKKVCNVPCIGCRKCVKAFPDKFIINGFRAEVNYAAENPLTAEEAASVGCPTGALLSAVEHLNIEMNNPDWSPAK